MATDELKQTLLSLHATLASSERLDPELQALLRLLDADIHLKLTQNSLADEDNQPNASAEGATARMPVSPAPGPAGLGSRAQEISARFAAAHPQLEPVLRELADTLQRIGI